MRKIIATLVLSIALGQTAFCASLNNHHWYVLGTIYYSTVLPSQFSHAISAQISKLSKSEQNEINRLVIETAGDAAAFQATGQKTAWLESLISALRSVNAQYAQMSDEAISSDIQERAQKLFGN